jgi:hypothetical protein
MTSLPFSAKELRICYIAENRLTFFRVGKGRGVAACPYESRHRNLYPFIPLPLYPFSPKCANMQSL